MATFLVCLFLTVRLTIALARLWRRRVHARRVSSGWLRDLDRAEARNTFVGVNWAWPVK